MLFRAVDWVGKLCCFTYDLAINPTVGLYESFERKKGSRHANF